MNGRNSTRVIKFTRHSPGHYTYDINGHTIRIWFETDSDYIDHPDYKTWRVTVDGKQEEVGYRTLGEVRAAIEDLEDNAKLYGLDEPPVPEYWRARMPDSDQVGSNL